MTVAELERTTTRSRVVGVDVARGVALFGMVAVHVFVGEDGPTFAEVLAEGRSAAAFAFIAGVSLTFLSGGRTVLQGRRRRAAAAGIATRGVLIGLIGLLLGYQESTLVILPSYGLMFLLAIPFLGLRSRALGALAAGFALFGPVLLVATSGYGLPFDGEAANPTTGMLLSDPGGTLAALLLTGEYPVITYLSYVCAGMAVGRLDLTSRRVAWWLFGGGLAAAVLAKVGSMILLYPLGGMQRLIEIHDLTSEAGMTPEQQLVWDPPSPDSTWWHLALASPHSHMPFDVVHTLGAGMAVLGAALLLTRLTVVSRVLGPVAAAGTMTLTLYCAHVVVLATGLLEEEQAALLLLTLAGATVFAHLWRRRFGQGPLERAVTEVAGHVRDRVAAGSGEPAAVHPRPDDASARAALPGSQIRRPRS